MQRDARTFLWDICDADAIQGYVQGRSFDDYLANRLLRAGVEREFVTIGEAMSQLAKTAPGVAARMSDVRRIIGFRNIIVHGYDRIEAIAVWNAVQSELPDLRAEAAALLAELGEPS
jgi:uncharacterized protein with HEPN domain